MWIFINIVKNQLLAMNEKSIQGFDKKIGNVFRKNIMLTKQK